MCIGGTLIGEQSDGVFAAVCIRIKIARVAVVSVALMLVGGCASYWLKPGATRQSFANDQAQCMAQAYLAAPNTNTPMPVGDGYPAPNSASCIECSNKVNWTGYPGVYVPPKVVPVDMNMHARTAMIDACMRGLGYTRLHLGIGGGAATITQAPVVESGNASKKVLQPVPGECVGLDDCSRGE